MSLVGTRPPTLDEWNQYKPHHRARMSFRPGLTGLWQVSGRSNITDFEEVVKLDTKYIDEWSLGVDVRIHMLKTLWFCSVEEGQTGSKRYFGKAIGSILCIKDLIMVHSDGRVPRMRQCPLRKISTVC